MTFRTSILLVLIAVGVSEISCSVEGDVTIGDGAIISPSAKIIAEAGPIVIGDGLIIEDNASIVNKRSGQTLHIGNGNIFNSGSTCEAIKVGNGNILKSNSYVGQDVELGNGIIVPAGCRLTKPQSVPDGLVVLAAQCE